MSTLPRRAITIPAYLALALLSLLTAPLWIPALAIVDARRSGVRAALRCGFFFTFYLLCETVGLLAAAALWLAYGPWRGADPERYRAWNFRLQRWWGASLLGGSERIFDFRVEAEGEAALDETPYLLFLRHASVADTLLASRFAAGHRGTRLRYVLKRELRWDPCLDVMGERLPNYFVDRRSTDPQAEALAVGALAAGLGPGEGVLIYPEGTRFTEDKRRRVLDSLRQGGDPHLAKRAEELRHVLPPRLRGPLALLEGAPEADVVICAHHGFEDAGTFWDLWGGALVRRQMRVRFWRVPRREIPTDREARGRWLFDEWSRVDDWIARRVPDERDAPCPGG